MVLAIAKKVLLNFLALDYLSGGKHYRQCNPLI